MTPRPLSASRALRGGRSASLATPAVTSRDGFLGLLPGILADICSDPATADMHPAVREHIKKAINYLKQLFVRMAVGPFSIFLIIILMVVLGGVECSRLVKFSGYFEAFDLQKSD